MMHEFISNTFRDRLMDMIADEFMAFQTEYAIPTGDIGFKEEFDIDRAVDNLMDAINAGMRYQIER